MKIKLSPATIEDIKKFEQQRTPDMARLAALILKAKGPERTMAKFGEETGIAASTLSRIVNHNFKKALSLNVIIKIFEHRADQEDNYLLENLARANGFVSPEDISRVRGRPSSQQIEDLINRERMMGNSLIASMTAGGLLIEKVAPPHEIKRPIGFRGARADFEVYVSPAYHAQNFERWSLWLFPRFLHEAHATDDHNIRLNWAVRDTIRNMSNLFLIDAWTPEELAGYKYSFAFVDEELYDAVKFALRIAKVNTEMSMILLDANTYRVLKEEWLPGRFAQTANMSILTSQNFMQHLQIDDHDEYDDDDYNTEDN